jgi:type IV secretory pathway VirB10-like protein
MAKAETEIKQNIWLILFFVTIGVICCIVVISMYCCSGKGKKHREKIADVIETKTKVEFTVRPPARHRVAADESESASATATATEEESSSDSNDDEEEDDSAVELAVDDKTTDDEIEIL